MDDLGPRQKEGDMRKKLTVVLFALLFSAVGTAGADLAVYFFDVGHGDAIYLELPNGYDVIMDGGWGDARGAIVDHISDKMIADGVIDLLIISHYHEDHYGGIAGLLSSRTPALRVERMVSPGMCDGEDRFLSYVLGDRSRWVTVSSLLKDGQLAPGGYTLHEADGYVLTLLGHTRGYGPCTSSEARNNSSVIVRLTGPAVSILFMGDACEQAESELIAYHRTAEGTLTSDVLKVGHHGSSSSTSDDLLRVVMPSVAVLSSNGNLGHPHQETLDRLSLSGVEVWQTRVHGTVVLRSDGATYALEPLVPPPPRLSITASASLGGTISPSGTVSVVRGDSQTFTIRPGAGFRVKDVVIDGASVGPVTTYTFTEVLLNHTIYAEFEVDRATTVSAYATRVLSFDRWNGPDRALRAPNGVCSTCQYARARLVVGGFDLTLPAQAQIARVTVELTGARATGQVSALPVSLMVGSRVLAEALIELPIGNCSATAARTVTWTTGLSVRDLSSPDLAVSITSGDGFGWRYVDAVKVVVEFRHGP